MDRVEVQRTLVQTEQVFHEGGPPPARCLLRGFACAVITNPYAGRYESDILPLMEALPSLGRELAEELVAALGCEPERIEGFGKGAIVGSEGEVEHGAVWHVPGGYARRELVGGARAIVPSAKKVGAAGARLDVPITHVNASYVRSHFDSIEAGIPGAPAPDQLVFVLAMTTGPRIHARVGGLSAAEIQGEDGLR